MRMGLFLTTLIGLAGASHISSAADATWAAVGALENGMSTSCGGGTVSTGPEWTPDVRSGQWSPHIPYDLSPQGLQACLYAPDIVMSRMSSHGRKR